MSESERDTDGFSESWLTLREPADHAARSSMLTNKLTQWASKRSDLHIVELGAGTGSNLRFLLSELGHDQHWLLIDYDATLLEHLSRILKPWAALKGAQLETRVNGLSITHEEYSAVIQWQVIDLASNLEKLQAQRIDLLLGSALLDLTSKRWLDKLASLCVEKQCACLFALNYDGQVTWTPELKHDKHITQLLNEHQLGDKGFGNALGPAAGKYFADQMRRGAREVCTQESPWCITHESLAGSEELQHAIIDGWAEAAAEQSVADESMIKQWHGDRKRYINNGESTLIVSHLDVLCFNSD